jgi:hypothetical protein
VNADKQEGFVIPAELARRDRFIEIAEKVCFEIGKMPELGAMKVGLEDDYILSFIWGHSDTHSNE